MGGADFRTPPTVRGLTLYSLKNRAGTENTTILNSNSCKYLTHNLYDSLDSRRDFTAIYLDITKYFYKIWHTGLLHKCKNDFGLHGNLLEWLIVYIY